jgi:hypothetical protein
VRLPFKLERVVIGPQFDAAYMTLGGDPLASLADAVADSIEIDVLVTVGDVTMHLAAWRDPEHWAEDWAAKLGCDLDDVPEVVIAKLAFLVEET